MSAKKKLVEMPLADQPGAPFVVPETKPKSMRAAVAAAKRKIAAALPEAVEALANESVKGSVTHLRLFMEVTGLLKGGLEIKAKAVREKTVEEIIDEEWEKQKIMLGEK